MSPLVTGHSLLNALTLQNRAVLGYYAASSGNFLPTFRDNLSVPFSGLNNPNVSPETSVRNYHYSLHGDPEERSSLLLRGGSPNSCSNASFIGISFN